MRILRDFQNQQIRLTEERWRHILEHPEMAGMSAALEDTLRNPQLVIRSRQDTATALHYRFYLQTAVGGKWLCVVVKFNDAGPFVLTAYLTDKPKKGEVIWRRP